MTPELQALYRRVAQALAAQGAEPGLLDVCPRVKGYINGHLHRKRSDDCVWCGGTGTVVPRDAECFWRLFKYAGSRHYELDFRGFWVVDDDDETRSTDPLDALLRAVAQSLGLKVA